MVHLDRARAALDRQPEIIGFLDGWQGVVDQRFLHLDVDALRGKLPIGGTILGTSRTNPYEGPRGGAENIAKTMYGHRIDGIIAIDVVTLGYLMEGIAPIKTRDGEITSANVVDKCSRPASCCSSPTTSHRATRQPLTSGST